jgi:hypothetical protein
MFMCRKRRKTTNFPVAAWVTRLGETVAGGLPSRRGDIRGNILERFSDVIAGITPLLEGPHNHPTRSHRSGLWIDKGAFHLRQRRDGGARNEASSLPVRRSGCRECDGGEGLDLAHEGPLALPVNIGVLYDTQAINPQVPQAQGTLDENCVPERAREGGEGYAAASWRAGGMRGNIRSGCGEQWVEAPAVREGCVLRGRIEGGSELQVRHAICS